MLKKILLNNLKFKIIAVILAFIAWAVVINITDPTITKTVDDIPITIENESAVLDGSHVYNVVSGSTASVTITGARSNVYKIMKVSAFNAYVDFSKVSLTGTVDVNVRLSDEFQDYKNKVTLSTTSQMTINIEEIKSKTFEPEIEFVGEPATGFEYEDVIIDPKTLTVYAPETVLKKIDKLVLVIDVSNASKDLNLAVKPVIYDFNGDVIEQSSSVFLDYPTVNVSAGMIQSKDIEVKVEVTGGVAEGYAFSELTITPQKVKIKGAPEDVAKINEIDLGEISIAGAKESVSITVDIRNMLPHGVTLFDEKQASVTATAHVAQYITKTLYIDGKTLNYYNIPEKLDVKLEENVVMEIKGPKDVIDVLTAANFYPSVDLKGAKAGTAEYGVNVVWPSGVTGNVSKAKITLTEKSNTNTNNKDY